MMIRDGMTNTGKFIVAGSISGSGFSTTCTDRSPVPDFTCGHVHRSYEFAEKCRDKLLNWSKDGRECSATWYNSRILMVTPETDSGYA